MEARLLVMFVGMRPAYLSKEDRERSVTNDTTGRGETEDNVEVSCLVESDSLIDESIRDV